MNRILYAKPTITDYEHKIVYDAIVNGWGEKCNEYIIKFENAFRKYIGSTYAIATSSCTGALTLGLAALDLNPGDEIILAETNWIATVSPVIHLNLKPIFVDVLKDTWCIDPYKVKKAITSKTKAIIATHIYGNLANMKELRKIAEEYNLYLIEDAAEAIGSEIDNKKTGNWGDFSTFSFHGTKLITTGEGGMLVTNNEAIAQKVRILNEHGRDPSNKKMFSPKIIGYKFKISNLQAALGYAQLQRIENLVSRKRIIFEKYKSQLKHVNSISMNPEYINTKNSYWMTTIVINKNGFERDEFIGYMKNKNIDIRPCFSPLSSFPMFKEKNTENEISYKIGENGFNVPSYHDLTDQDIEQVSNNIKLYLGEK